MIHIEKTEGQYKFEARGTGEEVLRELIYVVDFISSRTRFPDKLIRDLPELIEISRKNRTVIDMSNVTDIIGGLNNDDQV